MCNRAAVQWFEYWVHAACMPAQQIRWQYRTLAERKQEGREQKIALVVDKTVGTIFTPYQWAGPS